MADVKWIKITTDIFDDEKILLIENLPSADSIITIWFKLLTLAGKQNNSGVFLMNDRIAYNDEMLATIFRRDVNTVRLALTTFEKFGMIEIIDGVITIPSWNKHQSLDAYERRKERDREYQQRKRYEQKILAKSSLIEKSTDSSTDSSSDSSSDVGVLDKNRLEEEVEEDKEKENNLTDSKLSVCPTKDVERAVNRWNELEKFGIKRVNKLLPDTQRYQRLNKRIKQYGIDCVLETMARIEKSDFLQGNGNKGWVIDFEWFTRPNNFVKVMDGHYDNKNDKSLEQPSKVIGEPTVEPEVIQSDEEWLKAMEQVGEYD
jgi:predicted phage replisome organizer